MRGVAENAGTVRVKKPPSGGGGSFARTSDGAPRRPGDQVSLDLLRLVHASETTVDLACAAATFFQQESGCEAVGIRLKDGADYPYFESRGLPDEFIRMESSLCSKGAEGEILTDEAGVALLECMCGSLIRGTVDPTLPFITDNGSFWTNSTTELASTLGDVDLGCKIRGRCVAEGYESMAMLPLAIGSERIGLLQLADHRIGLFSPEIVRLWEGLSNYLAVAFSRLSSAEARRRDELHYRALFEGANDMVAVTDLGGNVLEVNRFGCELLGYEAGEIVGMNAADLHAEGSVATYREALLEIITGGRAVFEADLRRKDGTLVPVEVSSNLVDKDGGRLVLAVARDLRERRTAQEALEQKQAEIDRFFSMDAGLLSVSDTSGYFRMLSAGWERILGYTAEEMTSRPYLDFVHPDDRETTAGATAELAAQREVYDFVNRYVAKDGSIRWLAWRTVPAGELCYGTARDITDRKLAEEEMRRLNRALMALSQSNQALVRISDEGLLLRTMCDIAVNVGGYRLAWVGMMEDEASLCVRPVAWAGPGEGFLDTFDFRWTDEERNVPGAVALRTGKTQIVQDIRPSARDLSLAAEVYARGLRSAIAMPLLEKGRAFGLLAIYAEEPGAFEAEEVTLLEELAADLSYGITSLRGEQDRRRAEEGLRASLERFERGLEGTVLALVSALESRDAYTAGHQRRVAELAQAIAVHMDLPEDRVRGVFWAATLHDIGKLQVPAEILSKPIRLSGIEMAIVQTHAAAGYEILKGVDFPWPIAQTVLQHHERLDGSGYPSGLQAHEIILEARILAVADAVEARTSHRPYRPARDPDEMWHDMTTTSAAQFDQDVVTACREVFQGPDLSEFGTGTGLYYRDDPRY
jgi:PAS domain S-box-containing protein